MPALELSLGISQNLSGIMGMSERLTDVTRNHGRIVEEVQQPAAVLGEDDLLLSTLDGGSELQVVRLLDLLPSL